MPRALFEKSGNAIFISHLDLMRLFQRAFKRAGLPLTHTQGYSPRPSVSIALPLSVGKKTEPIFSTCPAEETEFAFMFSDTCMMNSPLYWFFVYYITRAGICQD